MNQHLVIFTLGPVQSFISQARKTQDLFAGSRMLSALTRKAFEILRDKVKKENITLVFPAFYKKDVSGEVPSNPNRFAVIVENVEKSDLKQFCQEVKTQIIELEFTKKATDEFQEKDINIPNTVEPDAKAQLKNHLEVYWAAVAFTQDYHTKYPQLESYLGGLKNIRQFEQMGETGRKCNIDGTRNALFVRHAINDNLNELPKPSFVQVPYCKIRIDDTRLEPGEGLSAVSMYKRVYQKGISEDFPSTANVALMEMLNDIKNDPDQQQLLDSYKSFFKKNGKKGDWDEQLLFEENLTLKYFQKKGLIVNKENGNWIFRKDIKDAYENLVRKTRDFKPSYYSILLFDGDRMGEWIGGKHLTEGSKDKLLPFQKKLRDLLRDFAAWAEEYLQAPRGRAVYAGGDDFLGLVNLHHLLPVLKEMRKQFESRVNVPLKAEKENFQATAGQTFSFSAGISIAHYKEPLGLVLDEARKAEQKAKDAENNAPGNGHFAISIIRHSGGTTRCVLPFGENLDNKLDAMQKVVDALTSKNFSNKFIHNLIEETMYWDGSDPRELFDFEEERLLERSCNLKKEEKKAALLVILPAIGMLTYKAEFPAKLDSKQLKNITDAFRICDFLYRTTKKSEAE